MIRPALRLWLARWSEVLVAISVTGAGLWLALRGGWFYGGIGLGVAGVGVALLIGARRRMPFLRPVHAQGVVEVVEGAIRYYGATAPGGEIALRDLTEIRLLRVQGLVQWRLRSETGEALLIPADAAGAPALADAFTALPGIDLGTASAALAASDAQGDSVRTVWRRPDRGGLT